MHHWRRLPSPPLSDRLAILLSLLAVVAAYLVADRVFERIPHLEDEIAYAWQAQVYARGELTVPSPPSPKSILVPFVVDYRGRRFAKYPPGWPVMLAFGVAAGGRAWVNALLAGLGVWLTYRLGQRVFDARIALLAAFLTLISPFFLLNSGSLLSHPWALVLSLAFALAWLEAFSGREGNESREPLRWLTATMAGLSLGVLALTRPLTAVGVALPFFVHGLILLLRGDGKTRGRILLVGLLAASVAALLFLWQYAVTGDALLNPYTLWWKYDKVGFGEGYGRMEGGHNLHWAWVNLRNSLEAGWGDFFGWGKVSWLFLPFGAWAARRNRRAWLIGSVFPSLLLVYMAYWIGSSLFGPRYYYEGLPGLTLLTAAGIVWLAGRPRSTRRKARALALTAVVALLVSANALWYLPARLGPM
ncbi:MAG: phospholipid carrier-dependent glycosyltransferase, partial [Anaerolineae bacterium]